MTSSKNSLALLSVYKKNGLADLARFLSDQGVTLLSTGGSARHLRDAGLEVTDVSEHTGSEEILGGRVKTLHPSIHGPILANRDDAGHMEELESRKLGTLDVVAVNLYPFEEVAAKDDAAWKDLVENVDIGGVALLRAAAKNCDHVTILSNPEDYSAFIEECKKNEGKPSRTFRLRMAKKAFETTAAYDSLIASRMFRDELKEEGGKFPASLNMSFSKTADLRYGENPHQSAALYIENGADTHGVVGAKQLQGKELSFNNFLDLEAAWRLALEFEQVACAVIKHTNPCGVALGEDPKEAYVKALACDPISAFGSVVAFNATVSAAAAEAMKENFVECVIAPSFEEGALKIFSAKKNLRLLEVGVGPKARSGFDLRKLPGGALVEDWDSATEGMTWKVVTKRQPTDEENVALRFAWSAVKHVRSNAILLARGTASVGIGAGQMSRVDSVNIACEKAGEKAKGSVLSSDAFFPFRDNIDLAAKAGITALVEPGGSKRDSEVIEACDEHGLAMVFTGMRHFRH